MQNSNDTEEDRPRSWYRMYRGWMENELFAKEPYTEREAWEWMIATAAWQPKKQKIGSKIIMLERGQLSSSVRFLAEKWKWSKSRVSRFIGRLKIESMIGTGCGTFSDVITILNYSIYQDSDQDGGTSFGTSCGTRAGQERDKDKEIKEIKKRNKTNGHLDFQLEPPTENPTVDNRFGKFWEAYPRKEKRKAAEIAFNKAIKHAPFERIMAGLEAFADAKRSTELRFIKTAPAWLNGEEWEDYASAPAKSESQKTTDFLDGYFPQGWSRIGT